MSTFQMAEKDTYSFARPEFARVIDINLQLNVEFKQTVLQGLAILTVERISSAETLILDNYNLKIIKVTNYNTGSRLKYHIGQHYNYGCALTISLPKVSETIDSQNEHKSRCKIGIDYKTSKDCFPLVWLPSEQTADGKHPFLLSRSEYTYARAIFPCQDTPSVKFTYSAVISVPNDFSVIMSASLTNVIHTHNRAIYEFVQMRPIPAYGVVIVVGSLNIIKFSPRSDVFTEKTYFKDSSRTYMNIESIFQIAEDLCGSFWDKYNICVLPQNILQKHLKVECPNVIFVSPILLNGDISLIIRSVVKQISHMWTEYLVTCVNYNHLWLSKSLGMFIYKKIICKLSIDEKTKEFFMIEINRELQNKVKKYKNSGKLRSLLPEPNISPEDAMEYVPYEMGCMLLEDLEYKLGGPSVFEPFLKSYFYKFANKNINSVDWMTYLYEYFHEKQVILNSINWDMYLFDSKPNVSDISPPMLEKMCSNLAEEWRNWDDSTCNDVKLVHKYISTKLLSDIQKKIFLKCLYNSFDSEFVLSVTKLNMMSTVYEFNKNYELQFHWIRLYIKHQFRKIVTTALKFAIEFDSINYLYRIIQDLNNGPEINPILTKTYKHYKKELSFDTQKYIEKLLQEKKN